MKIAGLFRAVALAAFVLTAAGCGHRLVATGDASAVDVYPDEATYQKFKQVKQMGGPGGMIAGLGEKVLTKQVDKDTPVNIVSSDSEGAQIEVTDGPNKGVKGFVPKENVN